MTLLCPSWRTFLSLLILPSIVLAYKWPNPQLDELESQRYDRMGYNARALAEGVIPCDQFLLGETVGRANAADWLRTAYHDMATHNVTSGTGGLDASIRFEQDQPANVGNGFALTVLLLRGEANRYISLSDILALGAITAVEQCGGPKVNFRGGRVDATKADAPGVPEPQQDLATHTQIFARQGFTQAEMIGLVACGHTFGGVQHQLFPNIVTNDTRDANNTSGNVHFDSTFITFDNNIATEYLDGTTHNPLVVGPDETNSDKRIFSSDGNRTMNSFRNQRVFFKTCAELFARMVDTVPRGVQLTEVIEPMPVKPQGVHLVYMNDGRIRMHGDVRLWNTHEDPERSAEVCWLDRLGHECDGCCWQLGHTSNQVSTFVADRKETTSVWYSFNQTTKYPILDANSSISKFWFEIDEGHGKRVEDQEGYRYALQDAVMLADSSCRQDLNLTLGIAIRKGIKPTRLYLEAESIIDDLPVVRTINVPMTTPTSRNGLYNVFTFSDSTLFREWNIVLEVGNKKYATTNLQRHEFPDCA